MLVPDDAVVGSMEMVEPGTLWVAVFAPPPEPEVAVTVFVEGMPADEGTRYVVLNPPALSAVVVATVVPA